jgi:hypothetical protein
MAATATRAPEAAESFEDPSTIRFVNTVETSQRVTLPQIRERDELGNPLFNRRKEPLYRVIQFVPHRIGTDDDGHAITHGFYTPKDREELAALRAVCAQGWCRATEQSRELQSAYEAINRERMKQLG